MSVPTDLADAIEHLAAHGNREHLPRMLELAKLSDLKPLWEAAIAAVRSAEIHAKHDEPIRAAGLRRLILILGAKGGRLPRGDKRERVARQREIARHFHLLRNKLKLDDAAARITLPGMPAYDSWSYVFESIRSEEKPRQVPARVTLDAVLLDLQRAFEVGLMDPEDAFATASPHRPRKATARAQVNLLFGEVADWFDEWTGRPHYELAATAVAVVLNAEDVDAKDLARHYRRTRGQSEGI